MRSLGFLLVLAGCASSTGSSSDHDAAAMTKSPDLAVDGIVLEHADMAPDLAQIAATSCNAANQTIGAQGGPDACVYGARCDSTTMTCAAPPDGSCAMATGAPTWNSAARQAPVISSVTATLLTTTNGTTECAGSTAAALVTVGFYTPNALTTMDDAATFVKQVMWKKSTSGTGTWYPGTFVRMLPTANAHFGSFQIGINCGGADGVDRTAALYVMDPSSRISNTVCVTWM
jgi:hypothetical protein